MSSSRMAPASTYSFSEKIRFLDGWILMRMWGCFSRISLTVVGIKGVLRSQTLLSSLRMPIQYSCYIPSYYYGLPRYIQVK